jgi:hypothetical protein
MFQVENHWTDFGEIWYLHDAIGVCPKFILLISTIINASMTDA